MFAINNFKYRKGAYAIIEREADNKIAIASDETDVYFFLGGGMENGETIEEALKREILEETGYTIKNMKYFDKIESLCYSNKYGNIDMDATIFIAQFDKKITKPIEKDHKILWVRPQEYSGKLYHKYQNIILDKYIVIKKENK